MLAQTGSISMEVNKKFTPLEKVIMAVFAIVIVTFFVPIPISRELQALEIKLDDPAYQASRTVTIKGTYHIQRPKRHIFSGQITLSDYPLTFDELGRIELDRLHGASLWYGHWEESAGRPLYASEALGYIYSSFLMRKIAICVYAEYVPGLEAAATGWRTDTGYCIVPGAADREEALAVLFDLGVIPDDEAVVHG